jgi:hypothetical protein
MVMYSPLLEFDAFSILGLLQNFLKYLTPELLVNFTANPIQTRTTYLCRSKFMVLRNISKPLGGNTDVVIGLMIEFVGEHNITEAAIW